MLAVEMGQIQNLVLDRPTATSARAVVIGDEALLLPPGLSANETRNSLRTFLGGMPGAPFPLRALSGNTSPTLSPSPRWSEALPQLRAIAGRVTSWKISGDGRCVPTGWLESHSAEGRLAPVEIVASELHDLGSDVQVVMVTAVSRSPEPVTNDSMRAAGRPVLRSVSTGFDPLSTSERALGEGIERYALGMIPADRLVHVPAIDLQESFYDPTEYLRYRKEQLTDRSIQIFDPTEDNWWVQGKRLDGRDEKVWIPAALVFAPFTQIPSWTTVGVQNSSGAAFHPISTTARELGWRELVERDAFLRVWRGGRPIVVIEEEGRSARAKSILNALRDTSRDTRLLVGRVQSRASNLGVPVVIAYGPAVGICIGSCAGSGPEALEHAALECFAQSVMRPSASIVDPDDVLTASDHAAFFCHEDRYRLADGLLTVGRSAIHASPALIDCHGAFVVELELPHGVQGHAVRVIDSRLLPLTFGHGNEPLGSLAAAFEGSEFGDWSWPHPFP